MNSSMLFNSTILKKEETNMDGFGGYYLLCLKSKSKLVTININSYLNYS